MGNDANLSDTKGLLPNTFPAVKNNPLSATLLCLSTPKSLLQSPLCPPLPPHPPTPPIESGTWEAAAREAHSNNTLTAAHLASSPAATSCQCDSDTAAGKTSLSTVTQDCPPLDISSFALQTG